MPADFHFLRPLWLAATVLAPVVIWLLWRRGSFSGGWMEVVEVRLRPYVLDARQGRRQGLALPLIAAIALVACSIALAGPAWERQKQMLYRGGDALVVLLDLSRSMDTADLPPSRVTRAKLKLIDLLERRAGGETALIVYSGNAFTVVPLTDDTDTIAALVTSLSTDIMPSRGSYPAAALGKAQSLLEQAGAVRGQVLLIGDGGFSEEALTRAGELATAGFRVSVLGVGTSGGGPVPAPGGGFESDASGRLAIARLEETELRRIAIAGSGRYHRITPGPEDLDDLLVGGDVGVSFADGGEKSNQTVELWHDMGPWIVILLLPFAGLLFRRGWLLAIVAFVLIVPAPRPAYAFSLRDLWLTPDQQGSRELAEDDPAAAAAVFADPDWRAAALYRDGQYVESAKALADRDTPAAHYNRGNALARAGRLEAAIGAYDSALALDPEYEDAAFNKALLEQQQQNQTGEGDSGEQQPSDQSSDQQDSDNDPQESESGDSAGSDQTPSGSESQSESQDGDSGSDGENDAKGSTPEDESDIEEIQQALRDAAEAAETEQDAGTPEEQPAAVMTAAEREEQEREEAMEQWLRRVPNDPGGLLRRKFREQYERRGRDQEGNSLWPDNQEEPW